MSSGPAHLPLTKVLLDVSAHTYVVGHAGGGDGGAATRQMWPGQMSPLCSTSPESLLTSMQVYVSS